MGVRYQANIDITVNGTKFLAGEKIGESISPRDADFLLREKYIEKISARSEKENAEKSEIKTEPKKKDENPEQATQKGKNPGK